MLCFTFPPKKGNILAWTFLFVGIGLVSYLWNLNVIPHIPSVTINIKLLGHVIGNYSDNVYKDLVMHNSSSGRETVINRIEKEPMEKNQSDKNGMHSNMFDISDGSADIFNKSHIATHSQSIVGINEWLNKINNKKSFPNVLFIVADDMRPDFAASYHEHSPWIEPHMITPNLDYLASRGMLFRRAYCQFAWCNPSRSSFLTSRRPDTTMVHNNSVFFRMNNPNFTTLPQYFKENGYYTLGMGKIFHLMGLGNDYDEPTSWSIPNYRGAKHCLQDNGMCWQAVKDEERHGQRLLDEMVADHAVETINMLAEKRKTDNQPFFLALGMKKPHLNFQFPEHYMNHYALDKISMPLNPKASSNLPDIAWFRSFEIRGRKEYTEFTEAWNRTNPLPEWIIRDLRRAYYSCITYIDDQIGRVLKQLKNTGLEENTIISFIGDHGFHLGEHSIIGKNTAFEVANNSPMIIRVPGVTDNGMTTDKLVEFVDLFPTLAELAGLPVVPYCPQGNASRKVDLCTEGSSIVPLFKDPANVKWKDRVFYQYPHYKGYGEHFCMGYSIRTEHYRYTEWINYDYKQDVPASWKHLCAIELYDHITDPHEMNNLADDKSFQTVRQDLNVKLKAGWTAALPKI